ncbi:RpsU Ribosomal protein S21 [uncultured Caudovirales phage]|uniref:RpsU Ribosomal protein S21 n=1 Tax=uncultured Caudovirales phage TaxID=2100421 RepID=A0A6J5TBL0_9CAUD|nr:RpsU Ribosomal protein S21 [uncultured Caudovirales phage]
MSRDTPRSTVRGTHVSVKDGQVEKALRKFKNKIQDSGKLEELREREHYTKPTTKRRVAKNKAVRRYQKQIESDELAGRRPPRDGTRKRLY